MDDLNIKSLVKMGAKPIGGVTVTFYTNEAKDTLYLDGILTDTSQLPNLAVLKKVTQSLKGTLIEENCREFIALLLQNKKAPCMEIMVATPAKNGRGKLFIREVESDHVKMGEVIGKLSSPHQGENGINLFGQLILPTLSLEIGFSYDDSITIREDKVVALRDGKLIYDDTHHTLTVSYPYKLEISEDKMEAAFTYIDKVPLTAAFIHQIIKESNIIFGILENKIDEIVKEHQSTKKPIRNAIIAKGHPVVPTKQGRIVFNFEQSIKRNFDETEAGKVDYKNNNTIQSVKKDERIAIVKKAIPGKPGRNILGIMVTPAEPKEAQLRPVKNIRTNPEQLEFFAEKDGSPVYKHGTISVVDIMHIKGNLTLATGNINFEGSVFIEGDVGDDYTIKCEGDITVGGSVGSSKLIAGGKIQIGQGFNGRGNGKAECIGDFYVKFMKEATVNSESNVIVENEALNCNINALGQLLMEKSNLIGGEATVFAGVFINEIGSSLGIKTKINPGINFLFAERKDGFERRMDEIKRKTSEINNAVGPIIKDKEKLATLATEKRQKVFDLVSELKKLKQESDYIQQELSQFIDNNKTTKVNEVVAYTKVYPGSIFKIGYSQKEFKTEISGPVLINEDLENRTVRTGPIKMRNKPIPTVQPSTDVKPI